MSEHNHRIQHTGRYSCNVNRKMRASTCELQFSKLRTLTPAAQNTNTLSHFSVLEHSAQFFRFIVVFFFVRGGLGYFPEVRHQKRSSLFSMVFAPVPGTFWDTPEGGTKIQTQKKQFVRTNRGTPESRSPYGSCFSSSWSGQVA